MKHEPTSSVGRPPRRNHQFSCGALAGPAWRDSDWGRAWVEDHEILLTGDPKFCLVTDQAYRDFILDAEVKVPPGGNSGIQFRCHYQQNRVWGYQAEVDTSDRKWSGGLYDEGRRGWLKPLEGKPDAQAAFKNGEWNHYRIEAVGDRLRVWVNGVLTTDVRDSADGEGNLALQHHAEPGMVLFVREKGTITADFDGYRAQLSDGTEAGQPPESIPASPGFYREWIDACQGGPRASCDCVDYSGPLAEGVVLANAAFRAGGGFDWDADSFTAWGNPRVKEFLYPQFRRG